MFHPSALNIDDTNVVKSQYERTEVGLFMAIDTTKSRDIASHREDFAARVRVLATFVGGTKRLSERTGLSRAVIGKYLGGKSEPSRDRLVKLAAAGGISIRWLVTGEGDMRSDDHDYVRVPCHTRQRASGAGFQISSDQIVDHLAFKADWVRQGLHVDPKSLVLIEACGDWMVPTIHGGDLILIETADPPFKHDGVYVIMRPESCGEAPGQADRWLVRDSQ